MPESPPDVKNLFDRSLFAGRTRRDVDARIDMTPMIDTLLQLFVVFMLNMSFVIAAIPLKLPNAAAEPTRNQADVVISLTPDGIFLGSDRVSLNELPARLRSRLNSPDPGGVVLRADRALAYQKVLEVLAVIRDAGVDRVNLAFEEARVRP